MNDMDKCERAAQIFLLTIFTILATILCFTFGFTLALLSMSFKILKSFIALAIIIVDEVTVRKEVYHAAQTRSKSRVSAQGRI